jgi:hypothetical protein
MATTGNSAIVDFSRLIQDACPRTLGGFDSRTLPRPNNSANPACSRERAFGESVKLHLQWMVCGEQSNAEKYN